MVRYSFKLKKSYTPDLTRETEEDKLYGGINLQYQINKVYYSKIFGLTMPYYSKLLGTKVFLRPYKKYWDRHRFNRVPHPYWGKPNHPLTRMWIIPINKFPLNGGKIIPEVTLTHFSVKIFGRNFQSKDIAKHLFKKHNKFSLIIN